MLNLLPMLWWLVFSVAVGLCIGSFTNVLIYRLPLNRSLREPRWSACPHCKTRIRWVDNIPVVSFLRLGGRCRNCHLPISVRYPVVELLMAIVFLAITDGFLLSSGRPGLRPDAFGGADRFVSDWPMLFAHLLLFAALFAMSAIDVEHYWVDIRFSTIVALGGFVLHAIWTPRHSLASWPRPGPIAAFGSLAALAGLGVVWLAIRLAPYDDEEMASDEEPTAHEPSHDAEAVELRAAAASAMSATGGASAGAGPVREALDFQSPYEQRTTSRHWPAWGALLILVALAMMIVGETTRRWPTTAPLRACIAVATMMAVIVCVGRVTRESDQEIVDLIEEERFSARSLVLTELLALAPAAIFAILVGWFLAERPDVRSAVDALLHHAPLGDPSARGDAWQPLLGVSTAAMGFIVGGALGWLVRIVFTLVFGKEAFGAGDIHMMAAAGCVAGWPVVVLGFFLACLLAMLGWLLTLPFKRTRAIPLGPWLSLAFLTVVLLYRPLTESSWVRNVVDAVSYLSTPAQPLEQNTLEFVLPPEGHDFLRKPRN